MRVSVSLAAARSAWHRLARAVSLHSPPLPPLLQGAFGGIAHSLTRAISAGLLLPPPRSLPLPPERACSAVATLLALMAGALLPTAVLLHSEARSLLPPFFLLHPDL